MKYVLGLVLLVASVNYGQEGLAPTPITSGTVTLGQDLTGTFSYAGSGYEADKTIPKDDYDEQYVFVYRVWYPPSTGECWVSSANGGYVTSSACSSTKGHWQYDQKYFKTRREAVKYLTDSGLDPTDFVGIYQLNQVLSADDFNFTEGDKVTTHSYEQKEHWQKWELKEKK